MHFRKIYNFIYPAPDEASPLSQPISLQSALYHPAIHVSVHQVVNILHVVPPKLKMVHKLPEGQRKIRKNYLNRGRRCTFFVTYAFLLHHPKKRTVTLLLSRIMCLYA